MSRKTITVWLSDDDRARYQRAADALGVPVSTYLKRCADESLTPKDNRSDLRAFAADLRADLGQTLNKVVEAVALNTERDGEEMRRLLHDFHHTLRADQLDVVKKTIVAARGKTPDTETPKPAPRGPLTTG